MALLVEIDQNQANPQNIETRSGSKNGRDWSMTSQSIWLFQPNQKFPVQIQFVLPDGHKGYPSGHYSLNFDIAIDQGAFKALVLDTRKLMLVPATPKSK